MPLRLRILTGGLLALVLALAIATYHAIPRSQRWIRVQGANVSSGNRPLPYRVFRSPDGRLLIEAGVLKYLLNPSSGRVGITNTDRFITTPFVALAREPFPPVALIQKFEVNPAPVWTASSVSFFTPWDGRLSVRWQ